MDEKSYMAGKCSANLRMLSNIMRDMGFELEKIDALNLLKEREVIICIQMIKDKNRRKRMGRKEPNPSPPKGIVKPTPPPGPPTKPNGFNASHKKDCQCRACLMASGCPIKRPSFRDKIVKK